MILEKKIGREGFLFGVSFFVLLLFCCFFVYRFGFFVCFFLDVCVFMCFLKEHFTSRT